MLQCNHLCNRAPSSLHPHHSEAQAALGMQVRIEQVLLSSPPLVTTFKVTQLLGFYAATLGPLVGRTAQLSVTLLACRALAARTFTEQLKGRGDKLSRRPPQPPQDLSVPPQVRRLLVGGLVRESHTCTHSHACLSGAWSSCTSLQLACPACQAEHSV